jgi:hypothetical protein
MMMEKEFSELIDAICFTYGINDVIKARAKSFVENLNDITYKSIGVLAHGSDSIVFNYAIKDGEDLYITISENKYAILHSNNKKILKRNGNCTIEEIIKEYNL